VANRFLGFPSVPRKTERSKLFYIVSWNSGCKFSVGESGVKWRKYVARPMNFQTSLVWNTIMNCELIR
jgi:hypothetical protein